MAKDVIGMVLNDTYRVERLLAEGGMGSVYLATHARLLNKRFAVKVLKGKARNNSLYLRFRREAEIATQLGHPHIVDVLDFNEMPDGHPYLVMEYLEGETLSSRLRSKFPLSVDQTVTILEQVASGLQAAHEIGVIHRDIKPANIFLLGERDGPIQCKILDFGVSKIRDSAQALTLTNMLVGTFNYMSPEQAVGGSHEVDATTDIFALGTLTFFLLSKRLPFVADGPAKVLENVLRHQPDFDLLPESLRPIVGRALAKKKEDRYQRVQDFIAELKVAVRAARESDRLPAVPTAPDDPLPMTRAITASYGDEGRTLATVADAPRSRGLSDEVPLSPAATRDEASTGAGHTVPDGSTALGASHIDPDKRKTLPDAAPAERDAAVTLPDLGPVVAPSEPVDTQTGRVTKPLPAQVAPRSVMEAPTYRSQSRRPLLVLGALFALLGCIALGVYLLLPANDGARAAAVDATATESASADAALGADSAVANIRADAGRSPATPKVVRPKVVSTSKVAKPKAAKPKASRRSVKRAARRVRGHGAKRTKAPKPSARVEPPAKKSGLKSPSFDAPPAKPTRKPPAKKKRDETLGERIPGLDTAS